MKELIAKMDKYCEKSCLLNVEMHKILVEFVKKAGGEMILDNLSSGNDTLYAFIYNEDLSMIEEHEVDKVRVNGYNLELHIPDIYTENDEDKWYALMGGMVLINATTYNLCEVLPEYYEKEK